MHGYCDWELKRRLSAVIIISRKVIHLVVIRPSFVRSKKQLQHCKCQKQIRYYM